MITGSIRQNYISVLRLAVFSSGQECVSPGFPPSPLPGGPLFYAGTDRSGDETIIGVASFVDNRGVSGNGYFAAVQGPAARRLFDFAISQGVEAFSY